MATYPLDDEPEAGDDELIRRDEYRRLIKLFVARLEKVEELCFEDCLDDRGRIVRPSLEHLMTTAHRHISAWCYFANVAKWCGGSVSSALVSFAAATEVISWARAFF